MWEQFSKGVWQNNYGNSTEVINKTPCKHCRPMGGMIITIINVPKSALAMGFWCNEYHKTSLKKKIIFAGSKLARGGKHSYSAQQECEKWQSIASGDSGVIGRRVRCKDQTSGSHNHSEQRGHLWSTRQACGDVSGMGCHIHKGHRLEQKLNKKGLSWAFTKG